MKDPQASPDDLHFKVQTWLNTEGYPLEFATAAAFKRHGFQVQQGAYVRVDDDKVREIDVVAYKDNRDNGLIRIYHVLECKSSKDKPWVVFTNSNAMAPSACITQTISSKLGEAILWTQAGLESLHKMSLFSTPSRPGFNGRQAFVKDKDEFYNAMRSVSSLSTLLVEKYDNSKMTGVALPNFTAIAFPVIVVEGKLFEAYFDHASIRLKLEECQSLRCHWKGSPSRPWHTTIDIVTFDYLEKFIKNRVHEVDELLTVAQSTRKAIELCFEQGSLDTLQVTNGPRGVIGLPKLLQEILESKK